VPLVKNRPHVIHAHDLLALRSALSDIPENPTSATGRIYQRYIRRGFKRAKHFISVSIKTQVDLHKFGQIKPITSKVVYNGLNFPYSRLPASTARAILRAADFPPMEHGFIMHIGGDQWYKNQLGVIEIYAKYVALVRDPLPLCCISPTAAGQVQRALSTLPIGGRVHFVQNVSNVTLQAAYSTARALLFPSLAEGFGWPLVEAQACGCPVITTAEAPMTEVGGEAAIYLPRLKIGDDLEKWASHGARQLQTVLAEDEESHVLRINKGMQWATKFSATTAISEYLSIYSAIVDLYRPTRP
jgi:glycosyltransferase involved in cell wall biosynthesis